MARTLLTVHWLPLNPTDEERQTFDACARRHEAGLGWHDSNRLAEYLAKA